ncbi:2-amino-4-hydroxy-6-hydroxymethyldihydropteridinepyrophosphokinase (plasmid) [Legionella adelaidensis]|uniref:2-amino-4-hydroxy-6-hydroxymethyldihydropteridine pyrophosphokinase n=1 Tax=Legionella adelaidensis TaxID=45056 RepID=A0A0W0R227_9GAMM|nr:2-amino-4-hydroxy-6-hydroxymethyldihydropteridine diphosphokinase [Legionella adelaidensis]KTC65152.1 2-amino-4-hydroxy-6- hydroxymethyldihydropteridine pyrophosphokinase [Legionella adelaidensis]VEH85044.1 2-amino-4-hydroxy-6-hydroxymethyldihydropteridinepyrophosphokinase [Legionella adelaidensis]
MTICFLGLGSNLAHPQRQLRRAVKSIGNLPKTHILSSSGLYASEPCGFGFQPHYQNMVVCIKTHLSPNDVMKFCVEIEKKHKKIWKKKWGPRTLDIDLLLYGDKVIRQKNLIIPHPFLAARDFVLQPLFELAPNLVLPNGKPIFDYLTKARKFIKDCKN